MYNPASTIGESSQLANKLGTTSSNSTIFSNLPEENNQNKTVQPKSGINFVLYNNKFDVVEENTGYLPVDDKINAIQNLATDKLIMKEAGFIEIYVNNQAQTPVYYDNMMVTMTSGPVMEVNAYYPFGMMITDLRLPALPAKYNAYKFGAKELQTELGLNWGDFGQRMQDPVIGRFMVPDRFAEKYFHLSPYQYAANNPINNIDINGDSISIAQIYARDEQGNYINPNQVESFNFLAGTKEGKALLANFAAKGQKIGEITFDKDGMYHKKGINLSFDTNISKTSPGDGETTFTLDGNNLNIRIGVPNSLDIANMVDTYTHEIAIHATQNAADYYYDKVMDNSNIYPDLRKMNESRNYKQHFQERNVNRAMERFGVPIMQQYYKSRGIIKSNDEVLRKVYDFLNK